MLKVSTVATMLNVSKMTVYRMIEKGDLDHVWVTQHIVRIPDWSVNAILDRARLRPVTARGPT
jgi:excisionase family DNA binding protein